VPNEVFSARLPADLLARAEDWSAREGRTKTELARLALERFFTAGPPFPAGGTGSGPATSGAAPAFSSPSEDPDANASAEAAASGDAARGEALDVQTARVSGQGGGPVRAEGDLETARLSSAVWRELAKTQLAPGVDPDALHAALVAIGRLDADGQVVLTAGDDTKPLRAAIPQQLLHSAGASGSGRGRVREVALAPQTSPLEKGIGSQAYYEANRAKVQDEERRKGLGNR